MNRLSFISTSYLAKNFFLNSGLILALIFSAQSCKSPTGPVETQPGRTDYIWTVDTLYSPMNALNTIWGSSSNDVWTTGPGGTVQDRLFHFDGTKWTNYEVPSGCFGNVLYGFSKDNVWMGGDDGKVWHFDGKSWALNFIYQPNGWNYVGVSDIWGTSPENIYAVGVVFYDPKMYQRGFILHYDGTEWKKVYEANFYSQFGKIREENNKVYIGNIQLSYGLNGASDTVQFYEFNGSGLIKIYSNTLDNITYAVFNDIGGEIYFLISQDVYRYINGNFVKQFSINEPNFGYQIYGRNPEDIFLRMRDGLAHYNGTDVQYLFKFANNFTSIENVPAIFEKEVFFAVWDPISNINMVLHGKLK